MRLDSIISGRGTYGRIGSRGFKNIATRIECADGTTLSVQASSTHYCRPRTNSGPYTHVEVGYPSAEPPPTWDEYYDDGGVYGYVPVELVREYIQAHGGEAQ